MTPGARLQAAIDVLNTIDGETASADDVLRAYFRPRRYAGSKDRRAVRDVVFNILRHRARLDWWLAGTGGIMEPTNRQRALAETVLSGEDPTPLFGIGNHTPEALSDSETEMAANLKGQSLDHPAQPPMSRWELPHWLDESLRAAWGEGFEAEARALDQPASVDLRVNASRVSVEQAAKALRKDGVVCEESRFSPVGLRLIERSDLTHTDAHKKGLFEVQDEGSQLVSLMSGVKPGQAVCDYCAGAGGKTLALADMMGLQGSETPGRLVACDTSSRRLDRMTERLARAKLGDVIERHTLLKNDPWHDENAGTFDCVLVDQPCTGSGTWRRHPEAKWRLTPERIAELTTLQDSIMDNAAPLVKPGGRLVYITCSVLREENEDRVAAFLARHPSFRLIPATKVWAETLKTPAPVAGDCLRLGPTSTGTDGFFVAVFSH